MNVKQQEFLHHLSEEQRISVLHTFLDLRETSLSRGHVLYLKLSKEQSEVMYGIVAQEVKDFSETVDWTGSDPFSMSLLETFIARARELGGTRLFTSLCYPMHGPNFKFKHLKASMPFIRRALTSPSPGWLASEEGDVWLNMGANRMKPLLELVALYQGGDGQEVDEALRSLALAEPYLMAAERQALKENDMSIKVISKERDRMCSVAYRALMLSRVDEFRAPFVLPALVRKVWLMMQGIASCKDQKKIEFFYPLQGMLRSTDKSLQFYLIELWAEVRLHLNGLHQLKESILGGHDHGNPVYGIPHRLLSDFGLVDLVLAEPAEVRAYWRWQVEQLKELIPMIDLISEYLSISSCYFSSHVP